MRPRSPNAHGSVWLLADEVIDYTEEDFAATVRDVDLVIDSIGGDYGARSLQTTSWAAPDRQSRTPRGVRGTSRRRSLAPSNRTTGRRRRHHRRTRRPPTPVGSHQHRRHHHPARLSIAWLHHPPSPQIHRRAGRNPSDGSRAGTACVRASSTAVITLGRTPPMLPAERGEHLGQHQVRLSVKGGGGHAVGGDGVVQGLAGHRPLTRWWQVMGWGRF
ncbi:zinc-binding dehydrogenase [Nonomuraea sp. B10E8]|uniref:zinc-binding dehydrogenase n=1 Tax=Nonomuraea sp. B10E8 TaxID=3153559 RepID=UPI00325CD374